jgi:putative holliday junction resolvase
MSLLPFDEAGDPVEGTWRVMGIDYGTVRIGLAISDGSRQLATPLMTLDAKRNLMKTLRDQIQKEEIRLVVIGRPFRQDGSPGTIDGQILHFAQALETMGLTVVFWDESFSSQRAQGMLSEADHRKGSRSRSKQRSERAGGRLDRAAAAILLQEYLDANPQLSGETL